MGTCKVGLDVRFVFTINIGGTEMFWDLPLRPPSYFTQANFDKVPNTISMVESFFLLSIEQYKSHDTTS